MLPQCGLDKVSAGRSGDGSNCSLDDQEEVFRQQLDLAKQMSRPITVTSGSSHTCLHHSETVDVNGSVAADPSAPCSAGLVPSCVRQA